MTEKLLTGTLSLNTNKQTIILDQDQDSLLVKRRNDNHSPGPVIRKLVPSSHQRSELSNTILFNASSADEIRESGRTFQSLIVWGKCNVAKLSDFNRIVVK